MYSLSAHVIFTTLLLTCSVKAQTTITVGSTVQHSNVKRFGLNLGGQTFYDSGLLQRNLVARNPGFEGEEWQSVVRCKILIDNACTDADTFATWPGGFMAGATYEVLSGPAHGATGRITAQSKAESGHGVTLQLSPLPHGLQAADYLRLHMQHPGRAEAGWWPKATGGASFSTETRDLPPGTTGAQALHIHASGPGQQAEIASFLDTEEGRSFIRLEGPHTLRFRAKPLAGQHELHITLQRLDTAHGMHVFLDRRQPLQPGWHDYSIPLNAKETPHGTGSIALTFDASGADMLLDDVSLAHDPTPGNTTAFRDEVVATLRTYRPGILRYMESGTGFGASIDNLLRPTFGRMRSGYSLQHNTQDDIPIGIPDFLVLCESIGAEPWLSLPAAMPATEMTTLMDYLGKPRGPRTKSWAQTFPTIHLELGNEQWNRPAFTGAAIDDPKAYAQRAAEVFATARKSKFYAAQRFDLVAGSFFAVPWWTGEELRNLNGAADTVAVAPYLFSEFNSYPGAAAVFREMFAQPEQFDSHPTGLMAQQQQAAAKATPRAARLALYEVNTGTSIGSPNITQQQIDDTVPSLAAGLALADHMLLMLRDLGITDQCVFGLTEFQNTFTSNGGPQRTTPLWGTVVDMGGLTNRRRPTFLAVEAVNHAILPNMVETHIAGDNPTWDEPGSGNDHISLRGAHELQAFAFADGNRHTLIVFNLGLEHPRALHLNGPTGTGTVTVLNSARITDSNEHEDRVRVTTHVQAFPPEGSYTLPPHSMTIYSWQDRHPFPH